MIGQEANCYLCGSTRNLQTHHVYGGPNRKKSDKYGLTIRLCQKCHTGKDGVHFNKVKMDRLHRMGEIHALYFLNWDVTKWMQEFGRNYLEYEEIDYVEQLKKDRALAQSDMDIITSDNLSSVGKELLECGYTM